MRERILYVGLSRPKSRFKIGSLFIRWGEYPSSPFHPSTWFKLCPSSHAFIVFPAHENRPFYLVNEAAGTMVRFVSQPHFEDHTEVTSLYRFSFDKLQYQTIQTYGELHAGAPYAFMENIGIVLVRIAKIFTGRTIPNPFGAGDGLQKCSELVLRNVVERACDLNAIRPELFNQRGHLLPVDADVVGVRDIYEVLEFLSDNGTCERVELDSQMRVTDFKIAS